MINYFLFLLLIYRKLNNNRLRGTIPEIFGNLTKLEKLYNYYL